MLRRATRAPDVEDRRKTTVCLGLHFQRKCTRPTVGQRPTADHVHSQGSHQDQPFLYSFYHSLSSLRAESYSLPYAWIWRNRTTFHPCTMYSQESVAWSTDLPVFFDLGACVISSGNLFRVRPYGRALLIRHFFKLGTKERTSMVGCFTTVRVYELLT